MEYKKEENKPDPLHFSSVLIKAKISGVDSVAASSKGGTEQRRMETPSVKPGTAH